MWLPRISTLDTVNLDGNLRASDRAKSASRTLSFFLFELLFRKVRGVIPLLVQAVGRVDQPMGADRDAEPAIFAKFRVNFDKTCWQGFSGS
jgi:hypothetical protein